MTGEDIPRMSEEVVVQKKLKRRKRGRSFYYLPNVIIGIAVVALLLYLLTITVFRTTSVKVTGNHILSDAEVEKTVVTGKYKSYGIVQVLLHTLVPVKNLPFGEKVTCSIRFDDPHTLRIHVKEPEMIGYVPSSDGRYIYFNSSGKVAEISKRQVEGLLPVNGLSLKKAEKGKDLPADSQCVKALLQIIKAMKKYKIPTDSVTFADDRTVTVQSQTITFDFGTFDYLSEKLIRLSYIYPNLSGLTGTLHLGTWTPENTDIVFEKQE